MGALAGAGCASRSQTPFGNALAGETLFRGTGCARVCPPPAPSRRHPRRGKCNFPPQLRYQTEFGNEERTRNEDENLMRYLSIIAVATILFSGCAVIVGGSKKRIASITLRVPLNTLEHVAKDTERITRMVGKIAQQHGLTLRQEERILTGTVLWVIPGEPNYRGEPLPGQADVNWDTGRGWYLELERRGEFRDQIKCDVWPPKTGHVLQIVMWVDYASQMPPTADALWADLLAGATNMFGRDAILKIEDTKH